MNTAAARKFDDTAPLQSATRLRVVTFVGYAANDDIYDANINQISETKNSSTETVHLNPNTCHPLPNPPPVGEGTNVAHRVAQTLEDANGNRLQQIENVTGTDETTSYAFDDNDRLTSVIYPDKQTDYTFDNNANRLTEVTSSGGVTTLNKTYSYNTRNQLTAVADSLNPANSAQYTFDANGNQTRKTQNGSTTNFAYDVKDQLLSVNQNNANIGVFSYDYQGHRIVKDMGGSIVRYAYDGSSVLVETDTSGNTLAKLDYGPDRLLSMNHATEGRAYYLFDALGSVANLTTSAGGIQARYQYDAFGNYRSTAGASFNRFAFTGHEKDNETNLYYFKARFYDPETGRFLNQDAYLGDINTPPSLHRYLYAYGNPTVYVDLTGYYSWNEFKDEVSYDAGFITGAALGVATSVVEGAVGLGRIIIDSERAKYGDMEALQRNADRVKAVGHLIASPIETANKFKDYVNKEEAGAKGEIASGNPYSAGVVRGHVVGEVATVLVPAAGAAADIGKAVTSKIAKTPSGVTVEGAGLETKIEPLPSKTADGSGTAAAQKTVASEVSVGAKEEVQGAAHGEVGPNIICGSGGPCTVYEIPASELKAEKPYIGKTRRSIPERMSDADHRAKTASGNAPQAKALAENLTPDEAAGLETILAHERGLENLSNKIPPLNPTLPKNAGRIEAAKRLLENARDPE
jgi:RHS repeat-associated protein